MKNKIIKISVFFTIIILVIIAIIYQMTKLEVINTNIIRGSSLKTLETSNNVGKLAEGELDPDAYSYHTNPGIFTTDKVSQNSFTLPDLEALARCTRKLLY